MESDSCHEDIVAPGFCDYLVLLTVFGNYANMCHKRNFLNNLVLDTTGRLDNGLEPASLDKE